MANVQLPVLFQIADATGATLFGEEVAVDIIENHLKFTLKRDVAFQSKGFEANGTTSTLAAAFADTFYVGDDTAEGDALFYVNMIANVGKDETTPLAKKKVITNGGAGADATALQVVDMFCNKFADAVLIAQNSAGLVHTTDANKKVPIGGKAAAEFYASSLAPSESEALDVGAVMSRVAAVHLVGHPLAQAIFADEDAISTHLQAAPTASNPGNIFTSELAKLLSNALGGSQAANAGQLKAANNPDKLAVMDGDGKALFEAEASGAAAGVSPLNVISAGGLNNDQTLNLYYYNLEGVADNTGVSNNALKSLLEQLLNISGRAAKLNDVRGVGYTLKNGGADYVYKAFGDAAPNKIVAGSTPTVVSTSNVITAPLPIVGGGAGTGDTIGVFLRPKLKLKFENTTTGAANISMIEVGANGSVTTIASDSITTATGTKSGVATVFPGADAAVNGANQATIDAYPVNKYGWMGSDNAANTDATPLKRTVSQTSTDETEVDIMDQHVWRITIQM